MTWTDWPIYSPDCCRDVQRLLTNGTSLTAYKANPAHGPGPTEGSWAWKLEREAERVHRVPHVIACANGTVALEILLKALYPDGGEIITTAFTFSATVAAIQRAGLTPVFADVYPETGTLEAVSASRMRAEAAMSVSRMFTDINVLAIDLFGKQTTPYAGTLVDACQAVGMIPRVSHGVWSFNGRKNVPAGEGGAIFTRNARIAGRCRLAIGHAENFQSTTVGTNGHLSEVSACLAYHGMTTVKKRNAHRTKMARVLNNVLRGSARVTLPSLSDHALYMYPLIVDQGMERVADILTRQGIVCQRGYLQPPLHHYPAFRHLRRDGTLPNTEALSRDRLLLFPQVTPTATRPEMERLGEQILRALR